MISTKPFMSSPWAKPVWLAIQQKKTNRTFPGSLLLNEEKKMIRCCGTFCHHGTTGGVSRTGQAVKVESSVHAIDCFADVSTEERARISMLRNRS